MAWTHDRDADHDDAASVVRLLIGDVDSEEPLLTDAEIEYFTSIHKQPYNAASACALAIAAQFARQMATSTGDLSANFAAKHQQYLHLADVLARHQRSDYTPPIHLQPDHPRQFELGQMDNWDYGVGGGVVSVRRLRGYEA